MLDLTPQAETESGVLGPEAAGHLHNRMALGSVAEVVS
jgi:hypothetical protein